MTFVLHHAARYLTRDPTRADVLSVFAGLRPLVGQGQGKSTAAISRDHYLMVSAAGLVTITGGKWTTYRKMAEDTIDQAMMVAGLNEHACVTGKLRIHSWLKNVDRHDPLHVYGSDALYLKKLMRAAPDLARPLHPALPYTGAEVVWAVREEMARTVEDVLARRTRALLLDARASVEMAPAGGPADGSRTGPATRPGSRIRWPLTPNWREGISAVPKDRLDRINRIDRMLVVPPRREKMVL